MPIGFPSSPTVGQQWPAIDPIWEWDGVKWTALNTDFLNLTNQITSLQNTDNIIAIRGGTPNLITAFNAAAYFGATPTATEPDAFTNLMWDAQPTLVPGEMEFTISPLPADGGSPITALEYRVNTGAAIAFSAATTGTYLVTAGFTPGTEVSIQVRAVNAVDVGEWSDIKIRTPLANPVGGDLNVVQMASVGSDYTTDLTRVFGANVAAGNHILAAFNSSGQSTVVSGAGATVDDTELLGTSHIASALRTPSVAAPATSFSYSQSPTEWYQGGAIEVSGNAPVFTGAFPLAPEGGASMDARQIEVTVTHDNSIVVLICSPSGATSWTIGGGLTAGNNAATDQYVLFAYGKFNAGTHNITFQPAGNNVISGGAVAFVWRPGS